MLVEKAFTVTPEATREIAALAAETGVFAMEAMWTRFQPAIVRMRELIAEGAVGQVRAVQADLGVHNPLDPDDRFVAPELGGGALFDLTVYPISFAQMVLGNPTAVHAEGAVTPRGIDLEESVLLSFDGGATATLSTSLLRDPWAGPRLRHRRLDRRPAAVPPPRHDRAAPPRP